MIYCECSSTLSTGTTKILFFLNLTEFLSLKLVQEINNMKKNENCTILIQKKILSVAVRAAPGDLGLKSHRKDYQQKLTYYYGHPSKYKPRPMLLNPRVLGGWP